jgi:hypothetical protein
MQAEVVEEAQAIIPCNIRENQCKMGCKLKGKMTAPPAQFVVYKFVQCSFGLLCGLPQS